MRPVRSRLIRGSASTAVAVVTCIVAGLSAGSNADAATGPAVATTCPPGPSYSTTTNWKWADGPSLGNTTGADQWASASVTGLVDRDHVAGFELRAGTNKIRVGLSGAQWLIEPDGGTAVYGDYAAASAGALAVAINAVNQVTITYNGTVLTTRTVSGSYTGRGITPTIWQSSAGVQFTDIQSNAGTGCTSPSPSPSPTVNPAVPGPVSGLTATAATDSTLTVAWQAPTPGSPTVTGYKLGWTEAGTGRTWDSTPPHYSPSASPVTLTGLIAGTAYTIRVAAFNTVGDGPTVTGTGTTTGGSNGGGGTTSPAPMPYPAKAVAVYYMMWPNSPSPALGNLPAGINVLNLAFAQGDPPQLVGWSPAGKAAFLAGIQTLRARGVRIVLSIGGADGYINVANRSAFVQGVLAINAEVPLDGIDWDLEGQSMSSADVVAVSTALKQQRGGNFAVTMAPNGSNVDQYITVAQALNSAGALDMIGQQFYDATVSVDQANGRINQMIGAGIPENKVSIGMMIANDAQHWTLQQCITNTQTLKSRHPNLRGGYLWESGRAQTAEWVSQVGPILLS